MKELEKLLLDYGFYYDAEDMDELMKRKSLELVKKGYGDSREVPVYKVFGKDYDKFMQLVKKFNLKCPDTVWYD